MLDQFAVLDIGMIWEALLVTLNVHGDRVYF